MHVQPSGKVNDEVHQNTLLAPNFNLNSSILPHREMATVKIITPPQWRCTYTSVLFNIEPKRLGCLGAVGFLLFTPGFHILHPHAAIPLYEFSKGIYFSHAKDCVSTFTRNHAKSEVPRHVEAAASKPSS